MSADLLLSKLSDGDIQCLADALAGYIVEMVNTMTEFDGEPFDSYKALDLAMRLGILERVRESITEIFLRQDEEEREKQEERNELFKAIAEVAA